MDRAQDSLLQIFRGDWSQLEKRSEIKPPLKQRKKAGERCSGLIMQQA